MTKKNSKKTKRHRPMADEKHLNSGQEAGEGSKKNQDSPLKSQKKEQAQQSKGGLDEYIELALLNHRPSKDSAAECPANNDR
jgi:hypothetical protein